MTVLVAATAAGVLFGVAWIAVWPLLGRADNSIGGDVLEDPCQPSLRDRARAWLGLDLIHHIVERQEIEMAKVIDLLNALIAQNTAASAAQATSFHNIDAAFAKLQDAINNGDASPEVQAAADQLAAGFNSLQKAAEDEGRLYAPDTEDPQPSDSDVPPTEPVSDDTSR